MEQPVQENRTGHPSEKRPQNMRYGAFDTEERASQFLAHWGPSGMVGRIYQGKRVCMGLALQTGPHQVPKTVDLETSEVIRWNTWDRSLGIPLTLKVNQDGVTADVSSYRVVSNVAKEVWGSWYVYASEVPTNDGEFPIATGYECNTIEMRALPPEEYRSGEFGLSYPDYFLGDFEGQGLTYKDARRVLQRVDVSKYQQVSGVPIEGPYGDIEIVEVE